MKSCYLFGLVLLVHFSVAQNLFTKKGQWVNCAPQHMELLAGDKNFKVQQREYKKWCFVTESYAQLIEEQRLASLQEQQNQTETQSNQNTTNQVSNSTQTNQTSSTTTSNATVPVEPAQNQTTSNATVPVEPAQNQTTQNATTPVEPAQNQTTSNATVPVEPAQNQTTSNVTTPVEPAQNQTTSNATTPVEPAQNQTTQNVTTPVEPAQNQTTQNVTTPVEPAQNQTTTQNNVVSNQTQGNSTSSESLNVTNQVISTFKKSIFGFKELEDIMNQALQSSNQTSNATHNENSLIGNLSFVMDEIVSQAEQIANSTQDTKIPEVSDEKNRTVDNRTHYHYHYQSHTHTHEFVQTNLGQNISPQELQNAPYLVFDVLNKTLKFTQASVLPQGNFTFNLPPNVKVIEKYHYHYQWAFHEHLHHMSFLITQSTPWFVEFPWMKDAQSAQFLFAPKDLENLELSQQKVNENLQYNFKPLPFDDPLIFRQFIKGTSNQSETNQTQPEQPQKKEYLNIPFKDAGQYKTLQLPLDFNDTMEMPESNSTNYVYIYQFHSHVFNYPQQAETQQPASIYTRSLQHQLKISQKPFESVAQDETEVVVHYHVHQLLHLHLHYIKAAKGFIRQNPSQPQAPKAKYPRVQPYQAHEKPVPTPGIYYVPDRMNLKHGPNSKIHFHYKCGEKNFSWGQEYFGDIEKQFDLQSLRTKSTNSSVKIEEFNFIDREGDQKINSHAHFHYLYSSNFHNHTIGVREKEVPQVVYAFSNAQGANSSISQSQEASWFREIIKYALVLSLGFIIYKFLGRKLNKSLSKLRNRNQSDLDEGLLYRSFN